MISLNKHWISTRIIDRYATTVYSFDFKNEENSDYSTSNELKFELTIDPDSFISNFIANIDGEIFNGITKEKETASKEYVEAKEKNENAILISQPYKDISNIFQIKTNIDANSKILLQITIQQYLTKKFNFNQICIQILRSFRKYNIKKKYEYITFTLNIKDKSGIFDIQMPSSSISTSSTSSTLTSLSDQIDTISNWYKGHNNNNDEMDIMIDDKIMNKSNTECTISGRIHCDKSCINELILKYKIKGEQNDSVILYDNKSNIFCHIISDIITDSMINNDNTDDIEEGNNDNNTIKTNILIPRRVVFVIDKSGSMSGSKWNKTISATITALKQLKISYDRFSVILFDHDMEFFPNKGMLEANKSNINKIINYLQSKQGEGGTNINEPLLRAIDIIKTDCSMFKRSKTQKSSIWNGLFDDNKKKKPIYTASKKKKYAASKTMYHVNLDQYNQVKPRWSEQKQRWMFDDDDDDKSSETIENTEDVEPKQTENMENDYIYFMNQILFITDGEVSNTNEIILNVKNANNLKNIDKYSCKISIFSFGISSDYNDSSWINDVNHSFLKSLSINNNGIYKRIKHSNTDKTLNEYFNILSKPILSNINIKYDKNVTNLTETSFNTLYSGNDIIICGKIDNNYNTQNISSELNITATISAITGKQNNVSMIKPINICKTFQINIDLNNNNNNNNDIERIWAYLKLKQFAQQKLIYNDMIEIDDDEQKNNDILPLSLALKHKFITPWTSMIVVKKKEEEKQQIVELKNDNISELQEKSKGLGIPRYRRGGGRGGRGTSFHQKRMSLQPRHRRARRVTAQRSVNRMKCSQMRPLSASNEDMLAELHEMNTRLSASVMDVSDTLGAIDHSSLSFNQQHLSKHLSSSRSTTWIIIVFLLFTFVAFLYYVFAT